MTITEAYGLMHAVAPPDCSIFIGIQCAWYSLPADRSRQELQTRVAVSLVNDFNHCDQFTAASLDIAVEQCLGYLRDGTLLIEQVDVLAAEVSDLQGGAA